ncbi:hypothetical protein [Halomonas sp. MCCC 1A11057]|uniref:hypothetical protein n=1 Tax=Halomonas sp. MCCC 1A11057 TaxID=2733482 RepID=UPI001F2EE813|nr:hypothetical protein [Halomonas sp. MCCC 1A11057]MCE8032131.1 hypothetical protein [Halomonas sp. MCCC 1A11057]
MDSPRGSPLNIDDPRLIEWLRFWQCPWVGMDVSWRDTLRPGTDHGLEDAWQSMPPTLLRRRLYLEEEVPPMPGEALLHWHALSPQERVRVLRLAAEVAVRDIATPLLAAEERAWCRRLARALMPGNWPVAYPPGLTAEPLGLAMLRKWLPAAAWARVRLHYHRALVEAGDAPTLDGIPAARLDQLWHAVLWRVTAQRPDA